MSNKFRWTRERYKKAQRLNRLLPNFPVFHKPFLVERFHELWECHPSYGDPLKVPYAYRYNLDDIPF